MVKKESAKRGYMTPEDIRKHSKEYFQLSRIFSKGTKTRLLSKGTRNSIKQVMGELAVERFDKPYEKDLIQGYVKQFWFLHDVYKPDYIFLTETSATPMGYMFKEAWKKAYPGEKPPIFLRIIPGRGSKEFFEKRIKNKDAKIFIYDELIQSGGSLKNVARSLLNSGYKNIMLGTDFHGASYGPTYNSLHYPYPREFVSDLKDDVYDKIEKAKTEEEKKRLYEERQRDLQRADSLGFGMARIADHFGRVTYKKRLVKDKEGNSYIGLIDGDVGRIGGGNTAIIHAYKMIGRRLGQYILEEREKERRRLGNLENAVATLSVVSLIGGILFTSSNITGNTIANISSTASSFIGSVLLTLGIMAGFFWVKLKRK